MEEHPEPEGVDELKLREWEQLADESSKAYTAFQAYLRLGPDRSLTKTLQNPVETLQNPPGFPGGRSLHTLKEWCSKHRWVQRASAYDQHRASEARRLTEIEHAAKIKAYRDRASKIGAATADVSLGFLVAAGQRLKALTANNADQEGVKDIPIGSLPSFLRAAAAVAQISLAVEAEALGVHALEDMLTDEDEGAAES